MPGFITSDETLITDHVCRGCGVWSAEREGLAVVLSFKNGDMEPEAPQLLQSPYTTSSSIVS